MDEAPATDSTKLIALFNETDSDYYEPANELATALCEFAHEDGVSGDQLSVLTRAGICVEVGIPKYEYKAFKGGH